MYLLTCLSSVSLCWWWKQCSLRSLSHELESVWSSCKHWVVLYPTNIVLYYMYHTNIVLYFDVQENGNDHKPRSRLTSPVPYDAAWCRAINFPKLQSRTEWPVGFSNCDNTFIGIYNNLRGCLLEPSFWRKCHNANALLLRFKTNRRLKVVNINVKIGEL